MRKPGGLLLIAFATACFAQTPGPALTLPEAEALALKNHPRILASQAGFLRADQLVRETQSAYYPNLSGAITGSQANQGARIGAGFLTDSRLFNRLGQGIVLSQLITDSGRTPNLVASSKLQAQAGRQDYQATKDDVVLAVHQAYYGVLLAQDLIQVARQTAAARQTVVDQVSELTKNKLKSQVDLSFAQVNLSEAKLMLLRAQENLQSAYAALGQALGSRQAIAYQLTAQPLPEAPPTGPEPLINQAFQNRPELASMRLQQQSAERFARAERDLKLPTVSLTGVAGFLPLINPSNANPNIPAEYEGAAVNVNIPIFNGHLFSARRRAAEYQVVAANQNERALEDRIAQDVRTAWARAQSAYQAIGETAELLKQANLALDLAQGRYNLGLSSIVELSQAQLGQTQAQVENLDAQYDYQDAYAALQYALGLLR